MTTHLAQRPAREHDVRSLLRQRRGRRFPDARVSPGHYAHPSRHRGGARRQRLPAERANRGPNEKLAFSSAGHLHTIIPLCPCIQGRTKDLAFTSTSVWGAYILPLCPCIQEPLGHSH